MLMLLLQIIGAIATAFIALTLLKKDWRTKNEAIRKEAVLVTKIIIAVTVVSVVNLGISYFQSQIDINKKSYLSSFSAPDEIRTHIDGTGNHNSIH